MSFFSSIVNYVTGGGAKVSLDILDKAERGATLRFRVTAIVGESDIEIEHVTIKMRGTEDVSIPNVKVAERVEDGVEIIEEETVRHSETTFEADMNLTNELKLDANETYTWETEVDIPHGVLPTFRGRNAKHRWQVMAFLSMPGNDPDTGWIDFEVT